MSIPSNIIGIGAGVLTGISMLPQLVKIIREKDAESVSLPMLLILCSGLAVWVWYGVLKSDWPIIVTNGFSFLVNATIVNLKLYYRKH